MEFGTIIYWFKFVKVLTLTAPDRGRLRLPDLCSVFLQDSVLSSCSIQSCPSPSTQWDWEIRFSCRVEGSQRPSCHVEDSRRPFWILFSCHSSPFPSGQPESGSQDWFRPWPLILDNWGIWELFQFWYSSSPSHWFSFVLILQDPGGLEPLSPRSISPTEEDLKIKG